MWITKNKVGFRGKLYFSEWNDITMNILHVQLSGHYTENMTYQENMLTGQNARDGHNITIITNDIVWSEGKLIKVTDKSQFDYANSDGVHVIRLPYCHIVSEFISNKVRKFNGVYSLLEQLKPDVILFHGPQTVELLTVTRYKKKHPNIKLYVDSHADYYTTATNWLSLNILHRIFYKAIIQKCRPFIDKFLYISLECGGFLKKVYDIPEEEMEFYSLGGVVWNDQQLLEKRNKVLNKYDMPKDSVVFVQAGKMDKAKRLEDTLWAFSQVKDRNFRFLIAGSMSADVERATKEYLENDERIIYLGWVSGDVLQEYLAACDVYLQPGKVSAIAQSAICLKCAVLLRNLETYRVLVDGNGWLVEEKEDVLKALQDIAQKRADLIQMQNNSLKVARKYLDYKTLAARLYK